MSYRQLEESINKWTIELEEQEKIFLNQATQVNKAANYSLGTRFVLYLVLCCRLLDQTNVRTDFHENPENEEKF